MEERKLSFGLMRLPTNEIDGKRIIDEKQVADMVDLFIKEGFYHFDTAYGYHNGESEKVFGRVVASRYKREQFTLTDKMPYFDMKDPSEQETIFNEQLKRCQVSYFDIYFIHCIVENRIDLIESFKGFDFIKRKKEEGYIKHIGFSYHDGPELLDKILTNHPEIEIVQLQINYIDWEDKEIQARANYEVCLNHNKKVFVMEPVKGGHLVGISNKAKDEFTKLDKNASLASYAIRFAASLPGVVTVLSGMSNMEQLKDNISYMKNFTPLNELETETIVKVTNIINSSIEFKCTGCEYCIKTCPKKIKINEYFSLYNDYCRFGLNNSLKWSFDRLCKDGGRPSDCIDCKVCVSHCPQHLSISENLVKVKEVFEK